MKLNGTIISAVLLTVACDAASARTIRTDVSPNGGSAGWFSDSTFQYTPSFPLLSGIDPGITGTPMLAFTEMEISDENQLPIAEKVIPQVVGFSMPQALSYNWPNTTSPTAQVQVYLLDSSNPSLTELSTPSGALVNVGGDTEVEFNYSGSAKPGVASFTYDGISYNSLVKGSALAGDTNDFLFNASGSLVGWVNNNGQLVGNLNRSGWTAAAAPEIDPASGLSAFTFLVGSLAMLRARRRLKRSA